jgi:hypothetical protein
MSDILKALRDAGAGGVYPPQNWTTRAADRIDALEQENAILRKALHNISVVALLSDEPDGPRCRRMREIARKARKEKA